MEGQDREQEQEEPGHELARADRLVRNWNELLQEVRVMQTGAQILTGFLLTVPFSSRFEELDDVQRVVYLCVLVGSVVNTCVIVAPASFHRMLFRQRERDWLVRASHHFARAGLVGLSLVCAGVVLLVFDIVVGTTAAVVAALAVVVLFAVVWFGLPMLVRQR